MKDLSDNSKVLLAIIEIHGYVSRNEVKKRARKLTDASDDVVYSGPRPNFKDDNVFSSAWENLLRSGYLVRSGSGNNERYVANTDKKAVRSVCDGKDEERSIDSIIHNANL